jgi:hypothetical protein
MIGNYMIWGSYAVTPDVKISLLRRSETGVEEEVPSNGTKLYSTSCFAKIEFQRKVTSRLLSVPREITNFVSAPILRQYG